jgi:hypothetical protein
LQPTFLRTFELRSTGTRTCDCCAPPTPTPSPLVESVQVGSASRKCSDVTLYRDKRCYDKQRDIQKQSSSRKQTGDRPMERSDVGCGASWQAERGRPTRPTQDPRSYLAGDVGVTRPRWSPVTLSEGTCSASRAKWVGQERSHSYRGREARLSPVSSLRTCPRSSPCRKRHARPCLQRPRRLCVQKRMHCSGGGYRVLGARAGADWVRLMSRRGAR